MAKARASRFLENLRVLVIGVPALVGCFLGSVGGGVIWVLSCDAALGFTSIIRCWWCASALAFVR